MLNIIINGYLYVLLTNAISLEDDGIGENS